MNRLFIDTAKKVGVNVRTFGTGSQQTKSEEVFSYAKICSEIGEEAAIKKVAEFYKSQETIFQEIN